MFTDPKSLQFKALLLDYILNNAAFQTALNGAVVEALETVLTTRGDVLRRGASSAERLALGAANALLTSDGTDVSWVIPAFLKIAGGQEIQGGFTIEEFVITTPANGATVTVNPSNGQKQVITNNVAGFTIAATSEVGDVELRIINGASAGTITFDDFNIEYPGGSSLDTVEGNEAIVYIFGFGAAGADYIIQARQ